MMLARINARFVAWLRRQSPTDRWFPLVAGAGIGLALHAQIPVAMGLMLALPYLWATAGTRASAGGAWLLFFLAGGADIARVADNMMGLESRLWTWPMTFFCAFLMSLPWFVFWPRRHASGRKVVGFTIAAVLSSAIPPLGILGMLNPLLLSGALFPGLSWVGIVLMLLCLSGIALVGRLPEKGVKITLAAFAMVALLSNATYAPPEAPKDWIAFDTNWGAPPPAQDRDAWRKRNYSMVRGAIDAAKDKWRVIVFPEFAAGEWSLHRAIWWLDLVKLTEKQPVTVLFGTQAYLDESKFLNRVMVAREGDMETVDATIPIPIGLWRPWSSQQSAIIDPFASNVVEIDGKQTLILICYEQSIVFPTMQAAFSSPEVIVGMSSEWHMQDTSLAFVQETSLALQARLLGAPYLRSVGR